MLNDGFDDFFGGCFGKIHWFLVIGTGTGT